MLDMSKFWSSPEEAVIDLGGTHCTRWEPMYGRGSTYPSIILCATVHGTPDGDVALHHVDCYGWCVSKRKPKKKGKKLFLSPKFREMFRK